MTRPSLRRPSSHSSRRRRPRAHRVRDRWRSPARTARRVRRQPGGREPLVRVGARADDARPRANASAYAMPSVVEPVEDRAGDAEHGVVLDEPQEHRDARRFAARSRRRTTAARPTSMVPTRSGQNWPGLGEHRAVQHAAARATPSSASTSAALADVAVDLVVRDLPRRPRPSRVVVAPDAPERVRSSRSRARPAGSCAADRAAAAARSGTSSTSGSMPIAASTAARTSSRTASSRFAYVGPRTDAQPQPIDLAGRPDRPGTGPARTRRPTRLRPTRRSAAPAGRRRRSRRSCGRPATSARACARTRTASRVSRTTSSER